MYKVDDTAKIFTAHRSAPPTWSVTTSQVEAPAPGGPRPPPSPTRLFGVLAAVLMVLVLAASYVAWAAARSSTPVAGGPSLADGTPAPLFQNLVDGAERGRTAVVPLGDPDGARSLTGLSCDRVHFAAGRGLSSSSTGWPSTSHCGRLALATTIRPAGQPCRSVGFGGVKPHVARAGYHLAAQFGLNPAGIGGVGWRPLPTSDHPKGLALDFFASRELGDRLAAYVLAHRYELGVTYVIWRQQINNGSGWRAMADRGGLTANHYDHVHVSFRPTGSGAMLAC
jgi:hypothetical protein